MAPKKGRRTKQRKCKRYEHNSIAIAVDDVRQGRLSQRSACRQYGIPRSTLQDWLHGRVSNDRPGPATKMDHHLEEKLVDYACNRAALGVGFGKTQFLRYAGRLALKYHIRFNSKSCNILSDRWWQSMKKRYPRLSYRSPEGTSSIRHQCMSFDKVQKYFHEVQTELEKIDEPACIWNMDETGVQLSHRPGKVIARKGSKYLQSRTSGNRELITCIAAINASGNTIPPHLIPKGKTKRALDGFNTLDAPEGTTWSVSDSGWTKQGIAELWFTTSFLPNIGPHRPQILILDGHDSHNFVELIEIARENNIILVELPAHTSHWLQPCDRSCFGPLKKYYDAECAELMTNFPGTMVCKATFCGLFKRAWDKSMTPSNIKSGFRACGIHPCDPNAIPAEAYLTNTSLVTIDTDYETDGMTDASAADVTPVLDISQVEGDTALAIIESALTEEQRIAYSYCYEKRIELTEPMFQAWSKLRKEKGGEAKSSPVPTIPNDDIPIYEIESITPLEHSVTCEAQVTLTPTSKPVTVTQHHPTEPVIMPENTTRVPLEPHVKIVSQPFVAGTLPQSIEIVTQTESMEHVPVEHKVPTVCSTNSVVTVTPPRPTETVATPEFVTRVPLEPQVILVPPQMHPANLTPPQPVENVATPELVTQIPLEPLVNVQPKQTFPFRNNSHPNDSDHDVLPYPSATIRKRPAKTNKQAKFFVLTSDEAYLSKKKVAEDKVARQQEIETRKLKRLESKKKKDQEQKRHFKKRVGKAKKNLSVSEAENETWECLLCKGVGQYPITEDWVQCGICGLWAHDQCTDGSAKYGPYVCDLCK